MNIKTLRKAAVAELKDVLTVPVFDSKVLPTQLKTLPAVIVFNDNIQATNYPVSKKGVSELVALQIDVLTTYSRENYADELDDTVEVITATLFESADFQNLWTNIESYSVDYNFQNDGEMPIAFASIKITGYIFKS